MSEDKKKVIEQSPEGEITFTAYGEFISYFHAHIDLFKKLLKSKGKSQESIDSTIKTTKSFMTANVKKPDHFFEKLPDLCNLLGYPQSEVSEFLNKHFADTLVKVQEKLKTQELEKKDEVETNKDRVFDSLIQEIAEGISFSFPKHHRFKTAGMLMVLENTKTGEVFEPQGLMAESVKAASLALETASQATAAKEAKVQAEIEASAVPLPSAPIPVAAPKLVPKPAHVPLPQEKSLLQELYEANKATLTGEKLKVRVGPDSDSDLGRKHDKPTDKIIDDLEGLKLPSPVSAPKPVPLPPPPPQPSSKVMEEAEPSFDDFDFPDPVPPSNDLGLDDVSESASEEISSFDDFDVLGSSGETDLAGSSLDSTETLGDFGASETFETNEMDEEEIIPRRREPVIEDAWDDMPEAESSAPSADMNFGDDLGFGDSSPAQEPQEESSPFDDFDSLGTPPTEGIDPQISDLEIKSYLGMVAEIRSFESESDQSGYQIFVQNLSPLEKSIASIRNHLVKQEKGEMVDWEEILRAMAPKAQLSDESMKALHEKIESYFYVGEGLDKLVSEFNKTESETKRLFLLAWPHIQTAFLSFPDFSEIELKLKKIISLVPDPADKSKFTTILTNAVNSIKDRKGL